MRADEQDMRIEQTLHKRVVVVLRNPKSGATDSQEAVHSLAHSLSNQGLDVRTLTDIETVVTTVNELNGAASAADSADSAHMAEPKRLLAVVAAGGDGTVSLLANRLPAGTPLTILPLGTENLLAKYLGITNDPEAVAELILHPNVARLDAGRANGKLFLVMASCGFDADVVQRLHATRTGHIRHWSYALPLISTIRRYRYPTIRVSIDGAAPTIKSRWAFIFNVPRYAMNLPIVADADPQDGQLDVCTFRGGSLFRGLYYFFMVLIGMHRYWTNSQTHQFRSLRLESDDPVPFQLDGDPGGHLPLEIEVLPGFLTLLVPAQFSPAQHNLAKH